MNLNTLVNQNSSTSTINSLSSSNSVVSNTTNLTSRSTSTLMKDKQTQRVSLPPISDILMNRLPPPSNTNASVLPPLPHQQHQLHQQQQQQHQQHLPFGAPQRQPLQQAPPPTMGSGIPPPNYKYYDYYYGSNMVPSHSLANHSISHSTALTRSPLSNNSSPVYGSNTTPPPPPPLRHNSANSYNVHQPPLFKTHSSPIGALPTHQHMSHQSMSHQHMSHDMHDMDDDRSVSPGANGKRKTRNNLPKEITYILLKWLNDHLNHPYPNSFEKNQLMMATGLNQQQLSNWFINARRRKIKSLKEQKRLNSV
ncbi:uncharacterized protein RJT20DRAFT_31367 [Scheffersomyces xylosifermentans]|uniref:uncharacterized protein n=1 Tax=Scheffersomyces xylosifermentans TaxID=1304137 RepID=UPI00315CC14D